MNTNTLKKRIIENKSLIFIGLLSLILTTSILYINSTTGILGRFHRDIYLYLIEALSFNGYFFNSYSYVNSLSPLIPFLTSLLFRLGFVTEVSIFFVTSVFFFFSVIGVYLFLRLRFDEVYSVFGTSLYCSFTIILHWACNGSIDIPSLCLYIWGIYFFIKATTRDKYFYISIPFLVLSVFAKYISIVGIPVVIIYLLSKNSFVKTLKNSYKPIFGGFLISLISIVPFIYFFITHNVYMSMIDYLNSIQSASSGGVKEINDFLYYILNLNRIIFRYNDIIGLIGIIILIIGILFAVYGFYKILNNYYNTCSNSSFNDKLLFFVLFGSIFGVFISFLLTKNYSFRLCVPLFYVSIIFFTLTFTKILNKLTVDYNSFPYDLLMITWLLSYFIFLSSFTVKAYRYSIAFIPPLLFFITYGFKKICELSINNQKIIQYLGIICLLIISFGHLTVDNHDVWVNDEKATTDWLSENINIDNVNIWSDRPVYAWYLKKDYHYLEDRGNTANLTKKQLIDDQNNLSSELLNANVDYYISHEQKLQIPHYKPIKVIGSETVFKRV